MVSSLELGQNTYDGLRATPHGSASPYLTATLADVPLAGPDLGALLRANGGGVEHAQIPAGRANIGTFDIQHISDGRFTAKTIENMHKGVLSAKTDAKWRAEMEDIRRAGRKSGAIGWKDYLGELRWFDHWFRNVRPIDYVRDGHQIEMVVHPWLTYYKGLGDCVPLDQKVIVRHRATNAYVLPSIGDLQARFQDYDALSYSESAGRFEFAPITAWVYKGRKPVLRIRNKSGLKFKATPDHRIFGVFKNSHQKSYRLQARRLDEVLRLSKTCFRGSALAKKLPALHSVNSIPAYQLYVEGMYVAEGHSGYPSRSEISNKNEQIIEKIKACLTALGVPWRERVRKDGVRLIYIKASYLSKRLYDQFGSTASEKAFPDEYLSLSQEDIATALAAYTEGDAYVPTHGAWAQKAHLIHNTTSGELKDQLIFLHMILGRPLSSYFQKSSGGAGKNPLPIWRLIEWKRPSRTHIERFPGIESCSFKASDCGEAEVCDISVAGNRNFLTNHGHLLHNCDDSSTLMAAAAGVLGAPHRFKTWKADKSRPRDWSHVTSQINVPGHGWMGEDLTVRGTSTGWEPPIDFETKVWPEPRWR